MVEPVSPVPPGAVGRGVSRQRWSDLTFVHWPVDPALVAPLLPDGTVPDVHDGTTYVGLVPFVMSGLRLPGGLPAPLGSCFLETNVRLYAVDALGRRGVVFCSLDASRLAPVLAARWLLRLPYLWSRMSLTMQGDARGYASSRRWPGPRGAGSRLHVQVGERVEPDALAHFLTARWRLFTPWYGGRTLVVPVEHPPWTLHRAALTELQEDLVAAAGLPVHGEPHVLWSPGLPVRVGVPRLLPRT